MLGVQVSIPGYCTFELGCCKLNPFFSSRSDFGVTIAGEFSNAVNDCGLYVNGVGLGTRYEGTYPGYTDVIGSCSGDGWLAWQSWNSSTKQDYMNFALSSMDALQVRLLYHITSQ